MLLLQEHIFSTFKIKLAMLLLQEHIFSTFKIKLVFDMFKLRIEVTLLLRCFLVCFLAYFILLNNYVIQGSLKSYFQQR